MCVCVCVLGGRLARERPRCRPWVDVDAQGCKIIVPLVFRGPILIISRVEQLDGQPLDEARGSQGEARCLAVRYV